MDYTCNCHQKPAKILAASWRRWHRLQSAIEHTDTHTLTQTNKQTIAPFSKAAAVYCSKLLRCACGSRTSETNGSQRTQSKDKQRPTKTANKQLGTARSEISSYWPRPHPPPSPQSPEQQQARRKDKKSVTATESIKPTTSKQNNASKKQRGQGGLQHRLGRKETPAPSRCTSLPCARASPAQWPRRADRPTNPASESRYTHQRENYTYSMQDEISYNNKRAPQQGSKDEPPVEEQREHDGLLRKEKVRKRQNKTARQKNTRLLWPAQLRTRRPPPHCSTKKARANPKQNQEKKQAKGNATNINKQPPTRQITA